MDKYHIYTECVNCAEICVNSIKSYLKYHNYQVNIYLCKEDKNYFDKHNISNKCLNFIFIDSKIKNIYNTRGHLATAMLWTNIIKRNKNKKLIHFDSDTIFRGNIIDDIKDKLNDGYDLVGPIRCYKNNLNNRDDIRHLDDVVSTYCFGFNVNKIDDLEYEKMVHMVRGVYNPLNFPILDFFDPISFNIIKNKGKVCFIDFNIIGGLNQKGSKDNKYAFINNSFDVGEKFIHFASVGSGINFKKSIESNINISVPKFYVEHSLKTLAIYKYLLFNEKNEKVPDKIIKEKLKFMDLIDNDFINFN